MRISDWSSDVCSSDLDQGRGRQPRPPRHIVRIPARIEGPGVDRSATIQNISPSGMALEAGLPVNPGKMLTIHLEGLPPKEGRARKSVVEGKSVSVRVDLGGGRIIKKKK